MSFIIPPSAVTSTSSIIIKITTVHPFATSWPSSPKGDARTLRDLLSVSYGKITILLTGSLRSPPPIRLRRTSPRESVSHDSQVALLPYESCSLASHQRGGNTGVVREVYAVQSLKSDSLKSRASFGNTIPRAAVSRKPKAVQSPVPSPHFPYRAIKTVMPFYPPRKKAADFQVRCFDFYH